MADVGQEHHITAMEIIWSQMDYVKFKYLYGGYLWMI